MSIGDIKTFNYLYNGLELEVQALDLGQVDGVMQTQFTVKTVTGYADVNAI